MLSIMTIVNLLENAAMTRIRTALMSLVLVLVTSAAFAQGTETVVYFHSDAIGSTRLVTDANGAVLEQYDYLPFGEPYPSSASVETRRFGGKERDAETGLDYFGARYYSSLNGRFIAVDPMLDFASALIDPQGWNRYAYAGNNPFKYVDPDGRNKLFQWLANPQVQRMLMERAERLATAAASTARAGYLWATSFFNSPTGQEVTQTIAETALGYQGPSFNSIRAAENFGLRGIAAEGGLVTGTLAGGAKIWASFEKTGQNLAVNVLGAYNPEHVKGSLGTLKAITEGALTAARAEGATSVTIRGVAVINQQLGRLLQRQGFQLRKLRLPDGSEVDAFEKTFEVQ